MERLIAAVKLVRDLRMWTEECLKMSWCSMARFIRYTETPPVPPWSLVIPERSWETGARAACESGWSWAGMRGRRQTDWRVLCCVGAQCALVSLPHNHSVVFVLGPLAALEPVQNTSRTIDLSPFKMASSLFLKSSGIHCFDFFCFSFVPEGGLTDIVCWL